MLKRAIPSIGNSDSSYYNFTRSTPSNCAQGKLNLVSSYSYLEAFYTLSAIILWIYDGKPPFILSKAPEKKVDEWRRI
ncbi:hypothetical protein MRB53_015676 [Persea americana]|uniref:Uncharacterized protein n=1 Tax=Persea americana TaxID=3435 RepID=A0ACC2LZT3_PERAE|nr:hypothetical protein MRB53_015676 [Persea americana]